MEPGRSGGSIAVSPAIYTRQEEDSMKESSIWLKIIILIIVALDTGAKVGTHYFQGGMITFPFVGMALMGSLTTVGLTIIAATIIKGE